ncbi:hypothetical protein GOODEAATRI_030475, partial [Goodea atripinnis]
IPAGFVAIQQAETYSCYILILGFLQQLESPCRLRLECGGLNRAPFWPHSGTGFIWRLWFPAGLLGFGLAWWVEASPGFIRFLGLPARPLPGSCVLAHPLG